MSRMRQVDNPEGESFPSFADGDVKIIITGVRQYQLHSGVLKNASPVMRELLANENAAALDKNAIKRGTVIRHKLVLVPNRDIDDEGEDSEYILQPVLLDKAGKPIDPTPVGVGMELEEGRRINPIFMAWDAVLGMMYNQPVNLGDSQQDGLSDLLSNAFQVTVVSEYLDCIRIVSKPIEATLLSTGQNLYKSIAANPVPWLGFASRVRSRAIFKEALIHGAGQFNQPLVMEKIQNNDLEDDVLQVLVRKGKWVQKTVSDSTRYLASYYPSMLLREVQPGNKDNVSRASYGNDIMMWIAISIFRHWACDLMASDRTHHAPDMGWQFINAICSGGDNYLSRDMLQKNFHTRFPMTGKGMACVEHRLAEIKDDIKQWALPLKINKTSLDTSQNPVSHYLHVNVHTDDYPWVAAEQAQAKAKSKEHRRQQEYEEDEEDEELEDDTPLPQDQENLDGTPMDISDDEEMFDFSKIRRRNPDSDLFNTEGAGDEEYDTEPNTPDEEYELMQTALQEGTREGKLRELRPGAE